MVSKFNDCKNSVILLIIRSLILRGKFKFVIVIFFSIFFLLVFMVIFLGVFRVGIILFFLLFLGEVIVCWGCCKVAILVVII